jgi:hypothetical protein
MTQAEARRRIEQAVAEGWTELDLAGLGLGKFAMIVLAIARFNIL